MVFVLLAVIVLLGVFLIGMYNSLVQLRVRSESAWSDIDVQLKRRHDLIPNLVETVKGYAAHEKGTFENIAKCRSQAMQATGPVDKAIAENQLTGALKSLFAVTENYPQLKSDQNFRDLQSQLEGTENRITVARNRYIQAVQDYNVTVRTFPTNLTAKLFGFQTKPNFTVANEQQISTAPTVSFDTSTPGSPATPPPQPAGQPPRQ
jgi:LemA protein